jgi:hypothetical protein
MRLWTLHPRHLDARGLVALWREGLLAQAVLRGRTRGYRHHPQLIRFNQCSRPVALIAGYLEAVRAEALQRGYSFDATKIARKGEMTPIIVTRGQLEFEWEQLTSRVRERDPRWYPSLARVSKPRAHPLFRIVRGGIADWERGHLSRGSS